MRREFEQACLDEKVSENETECALSKGKRVQIAGRRLHWRFVASSKDRDDDASQCVGSNRLRIRFMMPNKRRNRP